MCMLQFSYEVINNKYPFYYVYVHSKTTRYVYTLIPTFLLRSRWLDLNPGYLVLEATVSHQPPNEIVFELLL